MPLRWDPAFPPKAIPAKGVTPRTEWEAGLAQATGLRTELDTAGRTDQWVLAIADATFGAKGMWHGLPARVEMQARCAKNRALFALPPARVPGQKGRTRVYGEQARHPGAWLAEQGGRRKATVTVRGREIPLTYRVEGPYLIRGAAHHPVFLLAVKGIDKRSPRHKRRDRALG